MKILIVIDSLGTGGAQTLKGQVAKGLVQSGHQVDIFIYNARSQFFTQEFLRAGVSVYAADKDGAGFSLEVLRELRACIGKKYDVVISSLHAPSIYASLAVLGNRHCKLIVCEESSSYAPVPISKKMAFYFATLIADAVVVNSYNEAKLMRALPGRSRKTHVIWNGCSPGSIPFKPLQKASIERDETLLIVGRVAYPKNGVNLLEALDIFWARKGWVPKVKWVGRKDTDPRSRNMQKEMDLFLERHPHIARSWVWCGEVRDVVEYYQSCDALLHVSRYEGLPMTICEAMLAGCFVIASEVCDHPLLLGAEERGFLCDPLSPASICDALERFVGLDNEVRLSYVRHSREFAEVQLNRDLMITKYEELIGSLRIDG